MQGFLGRRGWVLENVRARVFFPGSWRPNLAVRDMELGACNQLDGRHLGLVVDELPFVGRVTVGN